MFKWIRNAMSRSDGIVPACASDLKTPTSGSRSGPATGDDTLSDTIISRSRT